VAGKAMNREIKFRVWDVENKTMIPWSTAWHAPCKIPKGSFEGQIDDVYLPILIVALLSTETKLIVQQYTGLKDSKGKEIYEGDMIKLPDSRFLGNKECIWTPYGHVWYSDIGGWSVSYNHMYSENSDQLSYINETIEVVGNIFENPDLIKP
jgi:uncharacterized phage protein (TIGR01671 family)